MNTPRAYWPIWMNFLRKQDLAELAAWVLEVAGPLNILGAQMLYLSQPFLPSTKDQGLRALANLLEHEDEAGAFIALLKGQPQ
jgi:hypothetical protein